MPIYEYKCKKCKAEFELLISLNKAKSKVSCPYCKSSSVGRLISNFAVSGKGKETTGKSCGSCSASNCSSCK